MNTKQSIIVRKAIEAAITDAGGQVALGKRWGVRQATISKYLAGERLVDPHRAMDIERLEKGRITRAQLRPDLWGG